MPIIKTHLKPLLLAELARHGILSRACRAVGITRQVVLQWRNKDEQFAAQYARALERGRQ